MDSSQTIDTTLLPRHIGIIMDGNGRWAKSHLLERVRGHEKGADVVREVVTTSRRLGVEVLSLFAFSTENWARPKLEVEALMRLLRKYLLDERPEIMDNNIRLVASGQLEKLPDSVREPLFALMADSKDHTGMVLNLCLSYGGRQEIVDACRAVAQKVKDGALAPEDITADLFAAHLYVPELPPVDLMIRTSGEQRLSGFMLWRNAYAEYMFPKEYWPEFSKELLFRAIRDYQKRERRFGQTSEQLT